MAETKDSLDVLERHRRLLEENVDKLSAALDEWKQWKSEYEALKKLVQSLPSDASPRNYTSTRQEYNGELVDDKELKDIFGRDGSKKPSQIVSLLANRIEYVTKNIASLEKQLETAENKLVAANVISDPDVPEDEEGLPITEIVEELDEDDKVISYSLRTPGSSQSQLMEALEKAGLEQQPPPPATEPKIMLPKQEQIERANSMLVQDVELSTTDHPLRSPKPKPRKKSVAFSEDTKSGEIQQRSKTSERVDELMRQAKVQETVISQPVIPADESEEEAQLRRDMLQYNLSELNPVVAELALEEGDFTDDLDSETYSEYDEDEDEDDEDKWGRSTASVMSDEYRQRMIEIQERLNKRMLGSEQTPNDDDDEGRNLGEGIGRIHIKADETPADVVPAGILKSGVKPEDDDSTAISNAKKGVRFAQNLDVAEQSSSVTDVAPTKQPSKPETDPLSDVIERKNTESVKPAKIPAKKASRFKMGRATDMSGQESTVRNPMMRNPIATNGSAILPERPNSDRPTAPEGPEGQTMSTSILERELSLTPKEPDELDAGLLEQQVAVEYHKMRNRLVQKQGGFMKEDESFIQPLTEEEGGPKRVSRFKAARLAKS
ncbi:Prefoldin subunit-domain-containing protein [Xylariales sp. AK1849]|nr:Prefoldin subunit-domain-containing protein [Xylariales sp. AK1849]